MAVTDRPPVLQALTLAALALPGLMLAGNSAAEDDEVDFQYSHYQEGKRDLINVPNNANPIEVDTIHGYGKVSLSDRIKLAFNFSQDTWSGATPITTAPLVARSNRAIEAGKGKKKVTVGASPFINSQIFLDKDFNPLSRDPKTQKADGIDLSTVHVLSMASPETRKQGDLRLGYEWDEAAIDAGFGGSVEDDYVSWFGNLNGRLDFNQKLTSLNLGLGYTNSDIQATLDHDAVTYINKSAFQDQLTKTLSKEIVRGSKQDWATNIGLTQIINKSALFNASLGYTHSSGYLENPYKVMSIIFADPDPLVTDPKNPNGLVGDVKAFLEQRPDERNQWQMGARYVRQIAPLNAALHFDYQYFQDDWGINAHTFQLDWIQPVANNWTITPKFRYYSQDAADFYSPYLISKQAFNKLNVDPETGEITTTPFDPSKLPDNFSSDHRLSAYGALSGGVTVSKRFAKGLTLEAGFEYYTHQGSLRLGGEGEGGFSDFDYFVANANLKVNLSTLGRALADGGHAQHNHHHSHGAPAPAGVMFSHMMAKGQTMVGYRYLWSRQAGDMLHGTDSVPDSAIIQNACTSGYLGTCRVNPIEMNMSMHMIDLMYAPYDWLNLMLMPQFMEMHMNMRMLDGIGYDANEDHLHIHETGGIGDLGMYALLRLLNAGTHHIHMGLGVMAPTGDVDIQLRRIHQEDEGLIHYGMQLGSGTWDFKPSLSYTGADGQWSWGAQMNGTVRMEDRNDSGYALGNMFQATAWGGYNLKPWLTASVRGVYTYQGQIAGQYSPTRGVVDGRWVNDVNPGSKNHSSTGPMDFPDSYGGRYWDVGFGLSAVIPSGNFQGHRLGVEWLQPVEDDVNGYQLERVGTLSATWSLMF